MADLFHYINNWLEKKEECFCSKELAEEFLLKNSIDCRKKLGDGRGDNNKYKINY